MSYIYLDFKKAFDSVPHGELLFKLHSIGITGNLWKWFEYYLSFRLQCVAVEDEVSELLSVKSGVPQGRHTHTHTHTHKKTTNPRCACAQRVKH